MIRAIVGGVFVAAGMMASQAGAQDVEEGAQLYQHYCATCHGIDATGHGPMAGVLVIQPADLTTLASDDGTFPVARVVSRIDGRDPLVSHGSPMPVYGPYFDGQDTSMKTPQGQPILTSQPIVDLVAYLETLQGN
ncbi:c-type cytochrome [Ruegeria lacuscaerulensis]|uniref:c-type cytochrome n=1 Tax=Ruegeria lacuscaerulensis TaxID=55218 RepID=UPI00147C1552|nr:cytochrome c [Ruegeria lacuscaerulensis]